MSKRGKASGQSEKKAKKTRGEIRNSNIEIRKGDGGAGARNGLPAGYWKACELARETRYADARAAYLRLRAGFREARTPGFGRLFRMILRFLTPCRGNLRRLASNGAGWLKLIRRACRPG